MDASLRVVGEDNLGGEIQRLAEGLGVERRGVHGRRSLCGDAGALPLGGHRVSTSLSEGQNLALTEAAMSGVLVVGTPVGHLHDLGEDAAVLVKAGDPEDVARRIAAIVGDRPRLAAARAGRRGPGPRRTTWAGRPTGSGKSSTGCRDGSLDISVVIPTCNRRERVLAQLRRLGESTHPLREVLVVDSSDEKLAPAIRRRSRRCPSATSRRAKSVCIQRNIGIGAASSPWILLLDDDNELPPDYLARLAAHLAAHPEAGAVSGLVLEGWTAPGRRSSPRLRTWCCCGSTFSSSGCG